MNGIIVYTDSFQILLFPFICHWKQYCPWSKPFAHSINKVPKMLGQGQGQEPLPELSHRIHAIDFQKFTHSCNVKKASGYCCFLRHHQNLHVCIWKIHVFNRQSVTDHGSSARSANLFVEGWRLKEVHSCTKTLGYSHFLWDDIENNIVCKGRHLPS